MEDIREIIYDNIHLCLDENQIVDNKTNAFLYNVYHEKDDIVFLNNSLTRPDRFMIDSSEINQTEISIAYSIGNSPVLGIVPMKIYNILLVILTDNEQVNIHIDARDFNKIIPFVQSKNISTHPFIDHYRLLDALGKTNYMEEFRKICDSL